MRILTVRQPWAWAIVHGQKDVENRVRNVAGAYRGRIAVHAGLKFDDGSWDAPTMGTVLSSLLTAGAEIDFTPGVILGVVDLVDVHDGAAESLHTKAGEVIATDPCSPWAMPDHKHLVLANPRPLVDPIPFRGALGLRRLDAGTIARIETQLTAFRPDPIQTIVTERLQ